MTISNMHPAYYTSDLRSQVGAYSKILEAVKGIISADKDRGRTLIICFRRSDVEMVYGMLQNTKDDRYKGKISAMHARLHHNVNDDARLGFLLGRTKILIATHGAVAKDPLPSDRIFIVGWPQMKKHGVQMFSTHLLTSVVLVMQVMPISSFSQADVTLSYLQNW